MHRLRNELMIFSPLLIYSNAMKWRVWSVCLDSGAVVIVWTALKMSREVFFLHNLDFYFYLYLLPKSKIDYDSPTILFLQAFILPSELLLEANFCEVLKKMKSSKDFDWTKKSTKTMSGAIGWWGWQLTMPSLIARSFHFMCGKLSDARISSLSPMAKSVSHSYGSCYYAMYKNAHKRSSRTLGFQA